MQRIPYALEQAKALKETYQHLAGEKFDPNDPFSPVIEDIAVSPFDQLNKKKFLYYYLLLNDAKRALTEEYKGLLFDVIVIAKNDDTDIVHESLELWLRNNNITVQEEAKAYYTRNAGN